MNEIICFIYLCEHIIRGCISVFSLSGYVRGCNGVYMCVFLCCCSICVLSVCASAFLSSFIHECLWVGPSYIVTWERRGITYPNIPNIDKLFLPKEYTVLRDSFCPGFFPTAKSILLFLKFIVFLLLIPYIILSLFLICFVVNLMMDREMDRVLSPFTQFVSNIPWVGWYLTQLVKGKNATCQLICGIYQLLLSYLVNYH